MINDQPLIVTLRLDAYSQGFFDDLRQRYFPPERNFLKAHLTLFHKLPNTTETVDVLRRFVYGVFDAEVTGLISLGAGVAYRVEHPLLKTLHGALRSQFEFHLTAQDKQNFRGHVTIQNKTDPGTAKDLLARLYTDFQPFEVQALGLDLWTYLGGPWAHKKYFPFTGDVLTGQSADTTGTIASPG
ncbi:2'-5' RNA ligase family protein [Pedobacter sp. SYP-B3415]|uniref:2'-5' RNA ligase family protein n=1 Tax=Pedobacter sp. SYP-B3415 TaxID=2496641 RepID=UPI00101CE4F2|nr:2'-5' RNA ligase family protein [Pedobacter sp. SYP-B3415]